MDHALWGYAMQSNEIHGVNTRRNSVDLMSSTYQTCVACVCCALSARVCVCVSASMCVCVGVCTPDSKLGLWWGLVEFSQFQRQGAMGA